ncbi:MAG: 50S ribosomal protein L18 [Parvularculaceae bacterium]
MADKKQKQLDSRAVRTRRSIRKTTGTRPRLSVFRSSKNISAQIIDDRAGKTLVSASTLEADLKKDLGKVEGGKTGAAAMLGKIIAERAVKAGVKDVVFDRGGYMYHGRVKALAEAAREAGLNF